MMSKDDFYDWLRGIGILSIVTILVLLFVGFIVVTTSRTPDDKAKDSCIAAGKHWIPDHMGPKDYVYRCE